MKKKVTAPAKKRGRPRTNQVPAPKTVIETLVMETGVPLPSRGVKKEVEIFLKKLRPLTAKMQPLINSVPIPKIYESATKTFLRREYPTRVYQVSLIKDNPSYCRIFRKK